MSVIPLHSLMNEPHYYVTGAGAAERRSALSISRLRTKFVRNDVAAAAIVPVGGGGGG